MNCWPVVDTFRHKIFDALIDELSPDISYGNPFQTQLMVGDHLNLSNALRRKTNVKFNNNF